MVVVLVSYWYCLNFWDTMVVHANVVCGLGLCPHLQWPLTLDCSSSWPLTFACLCSTSVLPQWNAWPFLDDVRVIHRLWNPRVLPQTHVLSICLWWTTSGSMLNIIGFLQTYILPQAKLVNPAIAPPVLGSPTTAILLSLSPYGSILMKGIWRPVNISSQILPG